MDFNKIMEREKNIIDQISNYYHYDSNIQHLLYVIISAFIIKYGINKEKLIINTFKETKIISSEKESEYIRAYFSSTPRKINGQYQTKKYMVIQNYKQIPLVELLDSIVHEFNHAINSYNNEIKVTNKYVYLRTGLTYKIYEKESLKFLKKQESYILEEIINTKQTNDVINIIKEITTNNREIQNTIYAINSETTKQYSSDAYYLQSYICKEILNNRTFISTLENLRINGEVYEIDKWFDNIIGEQGKYKKLIEKLQEVHNLEIQYTNQKLFKKRTIQKIRNLYDEIKIIISQYNNSVNFR